MILFGHIAFCLSHILVYTSDSGITVPTQVSPLHMNIFIWRCNHGIIAAMTLTNAVLLEIHSMNIFGAGCSWYDTIMFETHSF
jgi:hypothetical protein